MDNIEITIYKKVIYGILIGGLCIFFIFSFLVKCSFGMRRISVNTNEKSDSMIKYNIDSKENNNNIITIKGWIFKEGSSIDRYNCHVVLRDIDSDEYILVPTKLVSRHDVTEVFNKDNLDLNYDNSGFEAKINIEKLNKSLENYQICFKYNNNDDNELINTGIILENGEELK